MAAPPPAASPPASHGAAWQRAARAAVLLSWASLVWMTLEGVLGLVAGAEANSIGVISWAIGSAVEGAASVIVVWRLTGSRRLSESSERRAQKAVGGAFFLFIPYIGFEVVHRLITGEQPDVNGLAVALLASSIVLMPALGWAKLRLGRTLSSGATSGEGVANLICAGQAAVGLAGMLVGSAGAAFLDPVAAVVISAIAAKEGIELWRGDECGCHAIPGLDAAPSRDGCDDGCC
jgi:divalent metal cation (Fe/Co/Zn/Cd) transporter